MCFNSKISGSVAQRGSKAILVGLSASLSSFILSCTPSGNVDAGGTKNSSKLASVQMSMPSSDALTTTDGKKPINGARISIQPADRSQCPSGTTIDEVIAAGSTPSIQKKIAKGCDYDLRVELGKYQSNSTGFGLTAIGEVYYAPVAATRISASQTKDDKISVRVSLALTDEGRRIGLPENLPTPSPQPTPQPEPQPAPQPQPQPAPQPTPTTPSLPSRLNVNLTGKSGPVSLSSIFTTPYLVVDYSRPGCGPCVSLAKKLDTDTSFHQMTSGAKCRALTVVPIDQLSDWNDAVGGAHTAAVSYEYSHSQFAALFGSSISATPTVMIVDRNGQVVDKAVGSMPTKLKTICGN